MRPYLYGLLEAAAVALSVWWTWSYLRGDGEALVVALLLTVAWEAGKYLLAGEVAQAAAASPTVAPAAWGATVAASAVVAALLIAGSAARTAGGVLVVGASEAQALSAQLAEESSEVRALRRELTGLEADTQTAQAEVDRAVARGHVLSARTARQQLSDLRARSQVVSQRLDASSGLQARSRYATAGVSPRTAAAAEALGLDPALLDRWWSLAVGLIVELLGVTLIARRHLAPRHLPAEPVEVRWTAHELVTAPSPTPPPRSPTPPRPPRPPDPQGPPRDPVHTSDPETSVIPIPAARPLRLVREEHVPTPPRSSAHHVVWSVDLEDRYRDVLLPALRAGTVTPSMRGVQRTLRCSSARAVETLARLVRDGVCVRTSGGQLQVVPVDERGWRVVEGGSGGEA